MTLIKPKKADVSRAIAKAKGIYAEANDLQMHFSRKQNDLKKCISNVKEETIREAFETQQLKTSQMRIQALNCLPCKGMG